ncbi:Hyccin [Dufourea novaeangliae]|uniref:Hyccin n=1 Tax=Dufourea novaeangliae TaxID=178035 RepID=A0A154P0X0_DUFNO|nr:Hyccin [Dufourea novaeangliae]
MTESLINEWLTDCADVSPSELHTFATTLLQDNEIVRALYVLLEERSKYSQLVDTVCDQLYNFYRSQDTELQRFTLQFLPTLVYIYLNSAAHGDIKNCRSVETLLIGLYNLEIVDKSGQQKAISFRVPSLAMLSIYHEPASLAPASLTESAVRRFEECNTKLVSWGPLQQVETLNAQNRLKVMTALLFIYNQQLGYISKFALEQLCKVATKLVTQGFMKPGHHQRSSYGSESSFVPRLLPRIPVSGQFLLEFLHAVYFAMYNDCLYLGTQAVEDIHNRACYEAYPDVMLVTNAIRNSASSGPSGQLSDGPIGVSVALSPSATATVSKSMITNASFRTKKLPDDLDEKLFADEHGSAAQLDSPEQLPAEPSGSKWFHRQPRNSVTATNEEASRMKKVSSTSSLESSRRGSVCSVQSSPNKSSPKRTKDHSKRNTSEHSEDHNSKANPRKRKEQKEVSDFVHGENKIDSGSRLYSVLEEQVLGEMIHNSMENLYSDGNKSIGYHDIPIQVTKEDSGGEGKSNLVSITEEETTESNRVGSMRQSKDQKTGSKMTNFPVLGKKPREKDSKTAKNVHASVPDKEKKLGSQTASKESIKGSSSMLNSESTELDGNVGGCSNRKKNSSVENNSGTVDTSVSLIDGDRLALSGDTDNTNMETTINLRTHSETESLTSSTQVSSV